MGKTISFAIQKGGAGKTMSAGITSYLLAEKGYKVLAVDLDSQGNLTSLLTQRNIFDFDGETIVDAMKVQDGLKYAHPVMENLDIIPSNDMTATIPRFLYTEYKGKQILCLDETLKAAKEKYDFIIMDTPPALSEMTINSLCTSDEVVISFETSQWCYEAIDRFLETFEYAKKEVNPKLHLAGILCNVIDARRSEAAGFIKAIEKNYPDKRFKTIIKRQASTSRLPINGFEKNRELGHALKPYKKFIKELVERVKL